LFAHARVHSWARTSNAEVSSLTFLSSTASVKESCPTGLIRLSLYFLSFCLNFLTSLSLFIRSLLLFFIFFTGLFSEIFTVALAIYRLSQEERSIFGEIAVSDFQKKNGHAHVSHSERISEIEIFDCTVLKLFIRKRYYVLFLILVFSVQVTKLVQFT
jgi:hypothetical protein